MVFTEVQVTAYLLSFPGFFFFIHFFQCMGVFHTSWWIFTPSLNGIKSPQVTKTLLNIGADLLGPTVCTTLILILIYNSFSLISIPLETVPRAPIAISITVTFNSHSFSALWLDPGICWVFLFSYFHSVARCNGKIH